MSDCPRCEGYGLVILYRKIADQNVADTFRCACQAGDAYQRFKLAPERKPRLDAHCAPVGGLYEQVSYRRQARGDAPSRVFAAACGPEDGRRGDREMRADAGGEASAPAAGDPAGDQGEG